MRSPWVLIKTISFGFIFLVFRLTSLAQPNDLSLDLLLADSISKQQVHNSEKRIYIFKNQPKNFWNSNPVSLIYGGSLYIYQNFISQHFSADCLYDPGCSEFSKKAVKEFGLIKGGMLTIDRLDRCNRIAATSLNMSLMDKKTHRFSDPINRYK
jgi:putative membrane protein insertion efficiency factor